MNHIRDVISKVDFDDILIRDLSMNEFIFNYYKNNVLTKDV